MKNYFILLLCLIAPFSIGNDVNILDFGAVSDGKTLTTKAIQEAVDHCAEAGGGTVSIPAGTYLTRTIFLKDNVNLHIQKGATLLGDTIPTAFTQAIVFADRIQNAAITGLGTINGQGFRQHYPPDGPRHNNIFLFNSKNITVKDITLINSPTWVFKIQECDGVMVQGIRIYSFANFNNDGIPIVDSRNITISNSQIDTDDDAIVLKSVNPDNLVENIVISNCILATSCNAIKFGTESLGGFKNVSISNIAIRGPSEVSRPWSQMIPGVSKDKTVISGIALEVVDGGMMDQIAITNITMTGVQTPIFIKLGSRKGVGTLKNMTISNIIASDESLMTSSITGVPGSYIENVIIRDVIFNSRGTGTEEEAFAKVPERNHVGPENRMFGYSLPAYGLYARHVKNLMFENVRFNLLAPDARPAIVLDNCHNSRISNFSADQPSNDPPLYGRISNFSADQPSNDMPLLRVIQSTNVTFSGYHSTESTAKFIKVEGENSSNIKLTGNDFSQVDKIIELGDGGNPGMVRKMYNF